MSDNRKDNSASCVVVGVIGICLLICVAVLVAILVAASGSSNKYYHDTVTKSSSSSKSGSSDKRGLGQSDCYGHEIWVENFNDAGEGSFREAIQLANAKSGSCIRFKVTDYGKSGHPVILLKTRLPDITAQVDIDGNNNGKKVTLEGSSSDIDCAADTGIPPVATPAQDIPFLQIGDATGAEMNVAAGSVVRNLIFSNGGQNKNNVLPVADLKGPCTGVRVSFTSGVTVDHCDFHGIMLGDAAVAMSVGTYHAATHNTCEDVTDCIQLTAVDFSKVSHNTGFAGAPGVLETERLDAMTQFISLIDSSYNQILDNHAEASDVFIGVYQFSTDNVVKWNTGSQARASEFLGAVGVERTLITDNEFSFGRVHVAFPALGADSIQNPVIGNRMYTAADQAIDNGDPFFGSNGGLEAVITFNDEGDGDSGCQDLQNYPEISIQSTVDTKSGVANVNGVLNSEAEKYYVVECYLGADSNRNAHNLLARDLIKTDEEGNSAFWCECNTTYCKTDPRNLALSCAPSKGALYATATATQCLEDVPVCIDPRQQMESIIESTQALRSAQLSSDSSPLAMVSSAAAATASVHAAYLTALAANMDKTFHHEYYWPVCEEGGVAVCLHAMQLPTCNGTTHQEGKGHFKKTVSEYKAICPDGEEPLCLGSTSEVSYAVRVDVNKKKQKSSAGRLAMGAAAVMAVVAML